MDIDFNERVIGIDPEKLKTIDYSIGIVSSPGKAEITKIALTNNYINVLITNSETAKLLVEKAANSNRKYIRSNRYIKCSISIEKGGCFPACPGTSVFLP